jgi:glycosyltransferase involved in cell wall biosynthesis
MTSAPLISVVTPVYNGARYLRECIRSVREQSCREWEYVILDNQSTDETPAIAAEEAAADPRIRVVRGEDFLSVWGNHNRAVRAIDARSRYVKVVQADDWLYPECLKQMVAVAEAHPAVGVVSAFRLEGDFVLHDGLLPHDQQVMTGREVVRRGLYGPPWVTGSPTALLFRADLVRATPDFFDEPLWHADTDAAYRVLMQSDLGFVHQVLTATRLHAGALTNFCHSANTYLPQDLRMTLRYGPSVLSRDEYLAMRRKWLKTYVWYLAKQALKPSRHKDVRFQDFHRREIAALSHEVQGDPLAARLLRLCRGLLVGAAPRPGTGTATEGTSAALELSRYVHLQSDDARRARTARP